jgi:uncharacterized repeat protein (TIGR03847 family)
MPRQLFVFDPPDRFIVGTVGVPGQRTFYLQARGSGSQVSVSLEKVQVAVLAERLDALLDELDRRGLTDSKAETQGPDAEPLDEPLNELFRAGTLSLGWDADRPAIVIEAREGGEVDEESGEATTEVDDDDPEGPDVVRVRLTASQARDFVELAERVIGAGRPPCPMCGQPLDPQGHLCPRRNGTYLN